MTEILFTYNGTDIITCEEQENGMYKLTGNNGANYIVFKEEINI